MKALYATGHQVAEVVSVVERARLTDVVIKAPFMGSTLICCTSDRSHDLLKAHVAGLTSRGPG